MPVTARAANFLPATYTCIGELNDVFDRNCERGNIGREKTIVAGILKRWGKRAHARPRSRWHGTTPGPGSETDFPARGPFATLLVEQKCPRTFSMAWTGLNPLVTGRTFKREKPAETNSSIRPRTPHLASPTALSSVVFFSTRPFFFFANNIMTSLDFCPGWIDRSWNNDLSWPLTAMPFDY